MKAILMSIRPRHVANILNGIKTLEIRKKFPSDYVGWVYIYCTKKEPYARRYVHNDKWGTLEYIKSDGKVVARFWCDKVEEIKETRRYLFTGYEVTEQYHTDTLANEELQKASCLTNNELDIYLCTTDYFGVYGYHNHGKAIHITKLEIFDKPKEIKEFYTTRLDQELTKLFDNSIQLENGTWVKPLTRAPQSWCYVEI